MIAHITAWPPNRDVLRSLRRTTDKNERGSELITPKQYRDGIPTTWKFCHSERIENL